MYWWTGRGVWIGLIAGLPVLAAEHHPQGLSFAYLLAATILYLLKDWFGDGASLFSIPARFWPPLLFCIALLAYFRL